MDGVAHRPSIAVLHVWLSELPLCTSLALVHAAVLAGLLAVIQRFQMCNKMKTILVGLYKQDQQRLTVNIYFSPAIFSSSAVLHKSINIVKFYCSCNQRCAHVQDWINILLKSCPRNSSQLYHRKLPFSRAAPSHCIRTMVPPAGLMADIKFVLSSVRHWLKHVCSMKIKLLNTRY